MSKPLPLSAVHEVRDACLCLATQRAARVLARRFDAIFRPLGITNGQFSLMMALNAPRPMKLGQLAEFLAMDQTTMTAAIKALERAGLVVIKPDPEDRRVRHPALTEQGHRVLGEALPLWRAGHAALESELAGIEAAPLRAGLAALGRSRSGP